MESDIGGWKASRGEEGPEREIRADIDYVNREGELNSNMGGDITKATNIGWT